MKVRMLVDISGTRNGETWPQRGSVIDLPDDEAQSYVEQKLAVPITEYTEYSEVELAVASTDTVETRDEAPVVERVPPPRPQPPRTPKDMRGASRR